MPQEGHDEKQHQQVQQLERHEPARREEVVACISGEEDARSAHRNRPRQQRRTMAIRGVFERDNLPIEVFRHYMRLFDALPNVLLFDGAMFVHGGIPRDLLVRERWKDLSSLNDPDMRFQMMWSDPSSSDEVPDELQASSNRFAFGREQARRFLSQMGVRTLIRGHEKVNSGFEP